ncbi:bifunctional serine/threonine-protein kinase/formylglycine-generating enzyme family protein [Desmonostoc muscorum LEGE 12446]|uniref:SUMF1/EgtB/PvdO family nonheme iron enzyme n=1 Tax=Desmonostoc muscorum LEGE 12446 TaxID=1828758 RepID=A0A8J7CYI3_DESMC|nr:bifunctional serine/threonine-protein kinase/formylglycine-generating enzyme family protein [Desmonostoc muscorum]MCF2147853.1 bifunctional serine/threonine-protein kinase/formylglycine-generating enzyme family protein [Desmonostoc muscorum LEGE 12446]
MVWIAGQQLQGGKYVIEQILGQGGFGITYKARHALLNNLVVIKTPNESLCHDPEYPKYIKRFIDEGQRLEKLSEKQHPNIVRVRDLFNEGDTYCLVMDFVQGDSLFKLIQKRGALPTQEALQYIMQIGEALKVVHQAGLVHRDAHPGNIMIQQDGKAVLIDFGIAGETMPTTVSSRFFGNPGFAPHEQMRGDRKPYVDVYSLAASLYYAITAKRPTESFQRKAYNLPLVSPQEHISSISNELNQAILKGMEVEPKNRPQTMQEWLKLLTDEVVTIWKSGYQLQNGKYTIENDLAQGGFGITYLARDENNQPVVIKTLNETVQRRPDFARLQQDFLNEAVKLAKCNHPHVVKIREVFPEGQLWCMAMEYIEGEHLADRVQRLGVLSEAEALGYIQQIGEALTVVHQNGLLHRDVKPANIIVRSHKREAVLIDFGIAREFLPDLTQIHTPYLSHCFAPIEQYQTVAPRGAYTDIYALAATLYFLLTNRLPPVAPNRATGTVLKSPQQINSSISDRVNQAILKGMELEPENRPQTMQEWLELLKESPVVVVVPSRRKFIQTVGWMSVGLGVTVTVGKLITDAFRKELSLQTFNFKTVTVDAKGTITNRRNGEAKYFVEDLGNGVTLEMVQIPGGTFKMGSPEGEVERGENESPQHQVTVRGFFMGRYEVTQAQYQAIMGTNPARFQGEKLPVETVSWDDAVEFCQKLSQKTGRTYKLPSEAEWEYACRAGTTTPFYFGETITPDLVNYDGISTYASAPKGTYRQKTTPVGSFPPNAFGLYDMHGNVLEWCQDDYHDNYNGAPTDGRAWVSNNTNFRCVRGGSWLNYPKYCRSASRHVYVGAGRGDINGGIGFRVVCAVGRILQ